MIGIRVRVVCKLFCCGVLKILLNIWNIPTIAASISGCVVARQDHTNRDRVYQDKTNTHEHTGNTYKSQMQFKSKLTTNALLLYLVFDVFDKGLTQL